MKTLFAIVAAGIALVSLAFIVFAFNMMHHYNTIPTQKIAVEAKWGQVENVYKRRADLIPSLVEVVKGYAKHENSTFTAVTEARAKATQMTLPSSMLNDPAALAKFQGVQDSLGTALGRLMVASENYPELKADKRFAELQSQIEGTENRIAVERREYIKSVQAFNTTIATWPNVIWNTLWFHEKPFEQFKAQEGAADAPKVAF